MKRNDASILKFSHSRSFLWSIWGSTETFGASTERCGDHTETFGTPTETFGDHAEKFGKPTETFGVHPEKPTETFGVHPETFGKPTDTHVQDSVPLLTHVRNTLGRGFTATFGEHTETFMKNGAETFGKPTETFAKSQKHSGSTFGNFRGFGVSLGHSGLCIRVALGNHLCVRVHSKFVRRWAEAVLVCTCDRVTPGCARRRPCDPSLPLALLENTFGSFLAHYKT